MTTKEWLMRAINIDNEISCLLRERRKVYDRCLSITSRLSGMMVSGTKDPHKYDSLVEYESMIDKKIDELIEVKKEIQKAIWAVNDSTLRELLRRRYIDNEKFEQIACEMHYSYRHVIIVLHTKALSEVAKHINF